MIYFSKMNLYQNEETLNKTEKEQSFQEAYAEIFIETILSKIIQEIQRRDVIIYK